MKEVYADTLLWVALANTQDPWHSRAFEAFKKIGGTPLVTTQEVLAEFLTALSGNRHRRELALQIYHQIIRDPRTTVVIQSGASFTMGLDLYGKRLDKQYSLTDCISMETMRSRRMKKVLTNDHHFEQEGFEVLIR